MRRVVTLENPLSDAQSIMRPTLLGSLLDAARHNVARNGPDVAIFESGTVYRAAGATPERATCAPRRRRTPRARRAAQRGARAALVARRAARRPTSSPPRRCSRRCSTRFHVHWSVREARSGRSCIPGRSAAVLARDAAGEPPTLGFVGELHPLVAGAWDLERRPPPSRSTSASSPRVAPEVVAFEAFGSFPVAAPGPRRHAARATCPPRERAARACAEPAERTLDGAEIFDVYTGSQVGEGRRSLALALSFRAARAHAHRRGRRARARADRRGAGASSEVSCVAELPPRARPPARRRAGVRRGLTARARRRRDRLRRRARRAPALAPPALRARRRDRALGGRAAPRRPLPALPRAAGDRASSTSIALRAARRRHRRLPARRRRAGRRRRCASAACAWSTSAPTSACASLATYEQWYGQHPRPELLADAVYGLTELHRDADRRRRASSPTPAATRRPRCSALAPLARAGLIADVVIDAKQGISGAGRAFDETTHLSMAGENILPVQGRRTPPHARDRGAAGAAARGAAPRTRSPCCSRRTSCRSTRASSPTAT